jgi:hypothetical protein
MQSVVSSNCIEKVWSPVDNEITKSRGDATSTGKNVTAHKTVCAKLELRCLQTSNLWEESHM